MLRVLTILIVVMLTIYCVVEVAQARNNRVRVMPRWLWAFTVICIPVAGPITWLFFGRPLRQQPQIRPSGRAPDDDEDFLRGLR